MMNREWRSTETGTAIWLYIFLFCAKATMSCPCRVMTCRPNVFSPIHQRELQRANQLHPAPSRSTARLESVISTPRGLHPDVRDTTAGFGAKGGTDST